MLIDCGVEDTGAVTFADIVALAVIMNLKEFEQRSEARLFRIEDDLYRLGMAAMVAIGGALGLAACIADSCGATTVGWRKQT